MITFSKNRGSVFFTHNFSTILLHMPVLHNRNSKIIKIQGPVPAAP